MPVTTGFSAMLCTIVGRNCLMMCRTRNAVRSSLSGFKPRREKSIGYTAMPFWRSKSSYLLTRVATATSNPSLIAASARSRKCETKNQSSVMTKRSFLFDIMCYRFEDRRVNEYVSSLFLVCKLAITRTPIETKKAMFCREELKSVCDTKPEKKINA